MGAMHTAGMPKMIGGPDRNTTITVVEGGTDMMIATTDTTGIVMTDTGMRKGPRIGEEIMMGHIGLGFGGITTMSGATGIQRTTARTGIGTCAMIGIEIMVEHEA